MKLLVIITCLIFGVYGMTVPNNDAKKNIESGEIVNPSSLVNMNDPNKDMYVINAMVYQVGIITNKTDDAQNSSSALGNQEAITFFHTNGPNIDLSNIPEPLVTNVTAQRMIGVAPVQGEGGLSANTQIPWSSINNLANLHRVTSLKTDAAGELGRAGNAEENFNDTSSNHVIQKSYQRLHKRSSEVSQDSKTAVKIVSGVAEIPQDVGVHSIAIPPLLTFNNSFSEVPVPIPNTSVVHYAKVNTLIRTP